MEEKPGLEMVKDLLVHLGSLHGRGSIETGARNKWATLKGKKRE